MGKGLSPRVQGNCGSSDTNTEKGRSIPACAGEPPDGPASASGGTVYPRVCGGTWRSEPSTMWVYGLSPRVLGNRFAVLNRLPGFGSIPACAGEPAARPSPGTARWVYPRVCGGTTSRRSSEDIAYGLSPRVRGNQRRVAHFDAIRRSIPACAGEPRSGRYLGREMPVYPRVCGGTGLMATVTKNISGLSPRVRGNPDLHFLGSCHSGSIPAESPRVRGNP